MNRNSRILGIITHYGCEEFLSTAIESLLDQTRPLDGIVVVDDASPVSPVDIVSKFPGVTFLRSTSNVGPFSLIQNIVHNTHFDAYLQQDADDWSRPDRLAMSLELAERNQADLVGTRLLDISGQGESATQQLIEHPENARLAYHQNIFGWYMSWGTTLCRRELFRHIGGLATGLRLEADADFLRRASFVAKMFNVTEPCYYRRIRPQSLTSNEATGRQSSQRLNERKQSFAQVMANISALDLGKPVDLRPVSLAPSTTLIHEAGPILP